MAREQTANDRGLRKYVEESDEARSRYRRQSKKYIEGIHMKLRIGEDAR